MGGIVLLLLQSCMEMEGQDQLPSSDYFISKQKDTTPYILYISEEYIHLDNGQKVHLPALSDDSIQALFIIRHAEEDSIGLDPGLSDAGNARATRLVALMRHAHLEQLYSILFRRTVLTIRPLVKAYGLKIEHYDPDQVNYLTRYRIPDHSGNSLVVGTRQSVPILLNLLTGTEDYTTIPKPVYDRMYIVIPSESESEEVKVYCFRY